VSLLYSYWPGGYPCCNPDWVPLHGRVRQWPVPVIVLVIIVVITLAGWTPPEILRLLALLRSAG
jgi:hypothetical protein